MRKAIFLFLLCLSALSGLRGQDKAVATLGDLIVYARSLDRTEDRIVASGEVELYYKNIKLFADHIEVDTKTKDALATGHASLHLPEEVVDCEKISFNLDTKQGKFEKALGRIQPSILYEAASIERKSDDLYTLEKAGITSCAQPTPFWEFSFSRANFKKSDYIEMWGAVFFIKKIPVFYWPYMRYPLDKQRATGFLTPLIGYSQIKGFSLSESFYWAIARNMDATFSLDNYSAKGTGAGAEYRYLFNGGTSGEARFYYFAFKTLPDQVKPENAYIVRWNHNQVLPGGFNLVASVDYQTSFDFLKEFDNNLQRATVFNRSSQVYVSKSWAAYSFSVRAARVETNFPASNSSYIYYSLPQVSFDSFKMKLLPPLYFSFSSSFSRWQYGSDSQYKAKTQLKNQEFSASPTLSLPFNSIPWLNLNFSLEGNLAYSWRSVQSGGVVVDEPVLARNYVFSASLIGPVFYRIWDLGGESEGSGGTSLKHIIEPTVSYRYESPTVNGQKLLTPYGFYRYHVLTYGITNHILLKKGEVPTEIFTWGLSQQYYLAPEEGPYRYLLVNGAVPNFSEISSSIRFYPGPRYSIDFTASFNTYTKSFSGLRLGANLVPVDNVFLNVNWYKSTNPWQSNPLWDRHQIGLYGGINIPAISLDLKGEMDFNIIERKMLYGAVSAVYHHQCLDLKADVRIYYFREKPDIQYHISFGLGNIGKTTDFLGGARFD